MWEEISGGLDIITLAKREMNSRAYCGAFNFKGADEQKKVGMLSGGNEREESPRYQPVSQPGPVHGP